MKMKKLKVIMLASLATIITLIACKKGDIGPQGPAGKANVRVYHWNSKTTSNGPAQLIEYILPNEKYSQIDSIEWRFYVSNGLLWYPLSGTFENGNDYFRVYPRRFQNKDTLAFLVE